MNNINDSTHYHADFSKSVVVRPEDYQWLPSPVAGVQRMMLDRIGGETARTTSLVRYEPNSEFTPHTHHGGEEYFVIEGTFADEHGEYPQGSYVRNPVGSSHTPRIGADGATIFVKLHQFSTDDRIQKNLNTHDEAWLPGLIDGLKVMPLHEYEGEHIALVKWAPFTQFNQHQHWGGEEILVLEGTFYDEQGQYPAGSWLRSPHLSKHTPYTQEDGALIYVKVGHLPI